MANMIVSGAGTAEVNGMYVEEGAYNGKPRYKGPPDSASFYYWIYWSGAQWRIADSYPYPDGNYFYYSTNGVVTPDLVTTWLVKTFVGSPPAPTVTAEEEPEPPAKKYRYKPVSQLTGSIRQLGT